MAKRYCGPSTVLESMVTVEDIPNNQRISFPFPVTVREIDRNPDTRRAAVITGEDPAGNELSVAIWGTHDIEQQWTVGRTYLLYEARGSVWERKCTTNYTLHSTMDFHTVAKDAAETSLLFVGDTHVGFRHRHDEDKPPWAKAVDNRVHFLRVIERAMDLYVDAVVHAGDVFDHSPTEADIRTVDEGIAELANAGIPFYYIFGNHDTEPGREALARTTDVIPECNRLSRLETAVGEPGVGLYGLDHTGAKLTANSLAPDVAAEVDYRVLVLHETPHPLRDDTGKLQYGRDDHTPDLSDVLSSSTISFDLVVSGHMHVGAKGTIEDHDVPVVVTGPTAQISVSKANNLPSIWEATFSNGHVNVMRREL